MGEIDHVRMRYGRENRSGRREVIGRELRGVKTGKK